MIRHQDNIFKATPLTIYHYLNVFYVSMKQILNNQIRKLTYQNRLPDPSKHISIFNF